MLSKTVLAFAGLLASVQAIMVTSPPKDAKLDFTQSIDIIWTSVATDPSTFNLVLVDQTNMVPIPIKDNVKTSDNKYTLTNFVATPGSSYKFNLLSTDPLNTGILAQSQTFEIVKSGGASTTDTTTTSSSTTTTSASTGTAAVTGASDDSSTSTSTTLSTKTTAGTSSKTGSASTSETANASSSGATPVKSGNAAVALNGKTFGVAGSIFAGLVMLF